MAWIGSVLNVVGSVAGVAGSASDGQASAAQREYNHKLAMSNARITGDQSASRELGLRREARQTLGEQRAAVSESGTGEGGSNALLMAQDSALAELDALNLRYEGRLKMSEYDSQANMLSGEQTSAYQQIMGRKGIGAVGSVATGERFFGLFGGKNRAW